MSEEKKELTLDDVENPNDYDIDQLFKDAFANQEKNPYISATFWGPPEAGKTFTAMTFPGPIHIVDLEGGVRENLKYFKDKSNMPTKEIKTIRCVSFKDVETKDDEYDWKKVDPINTLKNFDVALTMLQRMHGGTVVVDSMTSVNDWLKALMDSRVQKKTSDKGVEYIDQIDWKYANQKWLWIWEKLKNIDANLVVIAREKPIYENREMTNKTEADLRMNPEYQTSIFAKFDKVMEQVGDKLITRRIVSFNKFRGNKLAKTYNIEDCTYDKIIAVLKEEDQI